LYHKKTLLVVAVFTCDFWMIHFGYLVDLWRIKAKTLYHIQRDIIDDKEQDNDDNNDCDYSHKTTYVIIAGPTRQFPKSADSD
jgi:hypothetical protein